MIPYRKPKWTLWFWWVLASVTGITAGAAILALAMYMGLEFLTVPLDESIVVAATCMGIVGIVIGAPLGVAQWLALRRHIHRSAWWIWTTTLGIAVGNASFFLVLKALYVIRLSNPARRILYYTSPLFEHLLILTIADIISGAVVGIFQWLVLRRSVRRTGWWILTNALIWEVAVIVGHNFAFLIDNILYRWLSRDPPGYGSLFLSGARIDAVGFPAVGIVVGVVTGFVLVLLLRNHRSE